VKFSAAPKASTEAGSFTVFFGIYALLVHILSLLNARIAACCPPIDILFTQG